MRRIIGAAKFAAALLLALGPGLPAADFSNQNITGQTIAIDNFDVSLPNGQGTGGPAIRVVSSPGTPIGQVTVSGSKIHHNSTTISKLSSLGHGAYGAVYLDGSATYSGSAVFTNTEISDNMATMASGSTADVNSWAAGGGGYLNNVGNLVYDGGQLLRNSAILGNGSRAVGGGLAMETNYGASATIRNSNFQGNEARILDTNTTHMASALGGGAYFNNTSTAGTSVAIESSTFTGNRATDEMGYGSSYIGVAAGGGVYFDGSTQGVVSGSTFNGNLATSANGAAMGGAIAVNSTAAGGVLTLRDNAFEGNQANTAWEPAAGGAVYSNSTVVSQNNTFTKNKAISEYSYAQGGALHLEATGNEIRDTTFTGNEALTNGYSRAAQGGALYMAQGTTTITDSDFTGNVVKNSANAIESYGGAIFVNTNVNGSANSILNLNAVNKDVRIEGNLANNRASGIYFGSAAGRNWASAVFNVDAAADRTVYLLDPVTVNLDNYSNFTMNKTGSGTLEWGGVNTFVATDGHSVINLESGTIAFGDDFTARGLDAGNIYRSAMAVNIGKDADMTFNLNRAAGMALFDFAGLQNTGNRSFSVQSGATITAELGRTIKSYRDVNYLIATGLNESDLALAIANLEAGGIIEKIDRDKFGNLVANVNYVSPYEYAGENARVASNAVESLINAKDKITGEYILDEMQAEAIAKNPWAVTPELYADHVFIMADGVDTVSNLAVNYGLIQPHRDMLSVTSSGMYSTDDAYGNMDAYCVENSYRIWMGYVGDFRHRESSSQHNGYKTERNGAILGINKDFGVTGSIGIYGGYTRMEAKARKNDSRNEANNAHFGALARLSPLSSAPEFSIMADAGYHFSNNTMRRNIQKGMYHASSEFDQDAFTAGLALEYAIEAGKYRITPQVKARYTYINQEDLTEYGMTATHMQGFNESAFNTRIGFEASRDFDFCSGMITPVVNLAWRREYGNTGFASDAHYLAAPTPINFQVSSSNVDKDSADIGMALRTVFNSNGSTSFGLNAGYNLNISGHTDTHSFYAGIEIGF